MYEYFDHTADLGIRVTAANLDELFAEAGRGLTAAIVEDLAAIQPSLTETLEITGDDLSYLFFDWLRELLLRFEMRRVLYRDFAVRVAPAGLTATLTGEPHDPSRHPWGHEVKAITYHGLKVERQGDSWLAEAIVDI